MKKIKSIIKKSGLSSSNIWVIIIFILVWNRDGVETAMVSTGIIISGYLLGINLLTVILQLKEKLKIEFDKKQLIPLLVIFTGTAIFIGDQKLLLFIPVIALPIALSFRYFK